MPSMVVVSTYLKTMKFHNESIKSNVVHLHNQMLLGTTKGSKGNSCAPLTVVLYQYTTALWSFFQGAICATYPTTKKKSK